MWNTEYGIRNTEYGIRNTEYGIRNTGERGGSARGVRGLGVMFELPPSGGGGPVQSACCAAGAQPGTAGRAPTGGVRSHAQAEEPLEHGAREKRDGARPAFSSLTACSRACPSLALRARWERGELRVGSALWGMSARCGSALVGKSPGAQSGHRRVERRVWRFALVGKPSAVLNERRPLRAVVDARGGAGVHEDTDRSEQRSVARVARCVAFAARRAHNRARRAVPLPGVRRRIARCVRDSGCGRG